MDSATKQVISQGPRCAMGAISGERVIAKLDEVYTTFAKPAQTQLVMVS